MLTRNTIGRASTIIVIFALLLAAPSYAQISDDETVDTDIATTVAAALAQNAKDHEHEHDYTWDGNDVVAVLLSQDAITIDGDGATAEGSVLTITSAGTYNLSGTLTDGQVIVDCNDKGAVRLILDGIDITCSSSAPIYVKNAKRTILILAEGSENSVTDARSYSRRYSGDDDTEDGKEEKPDATVFSKDDLTLCGDGALTVEAEGEDGITSKDGLIVAGGIITINAVDDGIRGKDYLVIKDGYITVTTEGDGLKSDNDTDETKGYILIQGGDLYITSDGDAMAAETDILIADGIVDIFSGGGSSKRIDDDTSAKGLKATTSIIIDGGTVTADSADDAVNSDGNVFINGGAIDIATGDDAVQADVSITINAGTLSISSAVEGLESPSITIDGGQTSVVASDNCINATYGVDGEQNDGSLLAIHGGTLVVSTTRGDGLDSNGNIKMTGGTVIVHGPSSQPELGMDCNGSCTLSGGFFIVAEISSNMSETPSNASSQCSVIFTANSQLSASTLFHIEDADGNDLVTFAPDHNYSAVTFSCPDLVMGGTYSIYTSGSSTGTVTNGLYRDGAYTPGTQVTQFTITSTVTKVSSSSNDPGNPGEPDEPGGSDRPVRR